jgi:hypothetical protein
MAELDKQLAQEEIRLAKVTQYRQALISGFERSVKELIGPDFTAAAASMSLILVLSLIFAYWWQT